MKFRRIHKTDQSLLASNFTPAKAAEFTARLDEAVGFIFEPTPGVVAGYGWATKNTRDYEGEKPFLYRIVPGKKELYIFDFFVKPEFRRRGVASILMKGILEYGRSQGFCRCFTLHDLYNSAMIKASENAGLRQSGILTYQRIGPWIKQDTSALTRRSTVGRPPNT